MEIISAETVNAIKDALAPVAAKIGEGAEYGWEVLVRGQFAEGVAMLVLSAFLLIVAATITVHGYKVVAKYKPRNDYDDTKSMFTFFLVVVTAVLVIFATASLYHGIFHVLAPEFKAIEFLLEMGRTANT